MATVHGHCDPRFEAVRQLLSRLVASGEECGATVAVNLDGEDVVDLWAGFKDQAREEPWERETICNVWSTTKTVTSLTGLMLIDRGLVEPTTKVRDVWPEFADKDDVEVRMLMSHTSGLSGWEEDVDLDDIVDAEKSAALLARQKPFWRPGTASGYHAITHGNLIGELVRRTTGKSLTQFTIEEISGPLKADYQFGIPDKDLSRTAESLRHPDAVQVQATGDSVAAKTMRSVKVVAGAADANDPRYRRSEIGGSNGYTNARALVRILSAISLGGEVDGVRLLKPETIDKVFNEQAFGEDLVMKVPVRWGMGFALQGKDTVFDWLPRGKICFWAGRGGSMVVMDVDRRLTIAYVMNKLGPHGLGTERTKQYVAAVYGALGVV